MEYPNERERLRRERERERRGIQRGEERVRMKGLWEREEARGTKRGDGTRVGGVAVGGMEERRGLG